MGIDGIAGIRNFKLASKHGKNIEIEHTRSKKAGVLIVPWMNGIVGFRVCEGPHLHQHDHYPEMEKEEGGNRGRGKIGNRKSRNKKTWQLFLMMN